MVSVINSDLASEEGKQEAILKTPCPTRLKKYLKTSHHLGFWDFIRHSPQFQTGFLEDFMKSRNQNIKTEFCIPNYTVCISSPDPSVHLFCANSSTHTHTPFKKSTLIPTWKASFVLTGVPEWALPSTSLWIGTWELACRSLLYVGPISPFRTVTTEGKTNLTDHY